jgi:glutamate 5-kinase
VIVVTSGAVGVGCQQLGLAAKPPEASKKQALAAVGQAHLMRFYEDFLQALGLVRLTCACP